MDALFVFTVAMFIAAPFAAPYPTLVGESPVQEFMGFTGSHPFQESTGRSSSFSGSIAYATITLSLSSSDNFKSMDPCSRVVREQQSAESSFFAFAPAPLSSLSSDKFKPMDSLSRVSRDKQIVVSTSDFVTLASNLVVVPQVSVWSPSCDPQSFSKALCSPVVAEVLKVQALCSPLAEVEKPELFAVYVTGLKFENALEREMM